MKLMRLKTLFCVLVLSACSSTNFKNSENPEEIYTEAVRLIGKGNHLEATELINELRHRFPQSRFAVLAEVRNADIYFDQESYAESAAAYGVFVDLYPNHAESPMALYRKALSYFNDAPEQIARDQAPARDAVIAADQLVQRYPLATDLVDKAKKLKIMARIKLASKEVYVAKFYEKRESYLAALRRWEGLTVQFSDLEQLEEGKPILAQATSEIAKLRSLVPESQN